MGTVPGNRTGRLAAGVSIADVARRTGIPASTLRFYEREMPGLFWIRKTAGGHRRYSVEDIERFTAIRRLTENEAIPLSEVRRVLSSRGDRDSLAEAVERLRAVQQETAWALEELGRRVSALEARIQELTASPGGRRKWFGKR
jgi:MerR family transcriptional regulator/heat shock protein HspR